jgi:hypothetical protein
MNGRSYGTPFFKCRPLYSRDDTNTCSVFEFFTVLQIVWCYMSPNCAFSITTALFCLYSPELLMLSRNLKICRSNKYVTNRCFYFSQSCVQEFAINNLKLISDCFKYQDEWPKRGPNWAWLNDVTSTVSKTVRKLYFFPAASLLKQELYWYQSLWTWDANGKFKQNVSIFCCQGTLSQELWTY